MRLIITFTLMLFAPALNAQDKILIAAASDLKFAMDSVIRSFHQGNSGKVGITYGSSGKLCEQIVHGAPFDVFFSADVAYPERLKKENKASSDIYHYGKGRIVIWSKKLDPNLKQENSLVDPSLSKIAMANPAHAPYGKRAMETLEYYKILENVKGKLVYGENISQAAQFVSTGAADIGIIALSLALSPNMKNEKGKYFLIPEESHKPLIQGGVITIHGSGKDLARSFFDFVKTEQAISILKHYGFTRP